jgi:Zn-finger nucleic acid-binding protein
MNCPKCGPASQLEQVDITGIEVDHCPGCKGVWLDEYELEDLLAVDAAEAAKILEGDASDEADAKTANCPRDGEPLKRIRTSRSRDTVLETCPECQGLWLDGGEFRRLRGV